MKDQYKNVLLVTNSTTEVEIGQIKQALAETKSKGMPIKLSLVHVTPTLPTCYFNIPSMVMLAERYYREAKETLSLIGNELNIPQRDQWLITGKIRPEVLRLASKLDTHFILAGSTSIQDLRRASLFNQDHKTPIRNINQIAVNL